MTTIAYPTASAADQRISLSRALARHGVSVVLPAYNEEEAICGTVSAIVSAMIDWGADYEVIVVNDGSRDHTGDFVAYLAAANPRLRLIEHPANQGYGAALGTGLAAATKDLTLFMDADGQFDIRDLARLLAAIDTTDAALGYRCQRQDSWLRRFNAWGWNALVAALLGVRVRDLDCAFKLLRTEFLHAHPPTTGGALINAELLYALTRSGASYHEIPVTHLPRQGGQATGARPAVILRALRDLAGYAWRVRYTRKVAGGGSRRYAGG